MSTNTSSYTIRSAPNVYIFVYILIETRIAPLMVKLNNKYVELRKVTCRQFYWGEIKIISERPTCYFKWESEYFFADFDWNLINIIPYQCTSDTYLQSIQYKKNHRYFPCKYQLNMWNIEDSNKCTYCQEIDTLSLCCRVWICVRFLEFFKGLVSTHFWVLHQFYCTRYLTRNTKSRQE